ncbi:NSFL1 cofactor p47-like [Crassostrea virginica]
MADNSQREKIEQFTNLTGVDADRAKFYLESSGWNIELAVASFYEHGDDDDVQVVETPPQEADVMETQPPPPQRTGASKSRFGTISALAQSDSDNSDSEDKGQAFYAGGSEHSGQQVLGPPRKKESGKKIVDNLFKSAREHGAEEVGEGSQPQPPAASRAFRGAGYKLGETEDDPVSVVQGKPLDSGKRQVDMVLKLWKNGFSIDDGPLRDFKDPANKEFLDSVSKGEVPQELLSRGKEVNINMEDHRAEDYVQPKVTVKPFTGEGHMLGSPAPTVTRSASSGSSSSMNTEDAARQGVKVNDSAPTTNLQVRLADGSRLAIKLNHTHKISDIRKYITIARPEYATATFVLMTTFPNKELTDENQSLADAKLLNAVIVQRMK